ncbi:MAG: cupin domain-containing protein [Candidatus Latescibacteria bacterium]|nr:cupin domain-containing protein [Candidatus Latescibacterota bacterium]NIO29056.1 cupin domain-containing protein [Candidatus Latescibacterota bacterium]NIO56681.1 cupin domain-containing protein [Candidatus Latescibacterota bacterium]NIT02264.1 cupin domain-containing protein [Candidatus Latescibacterota bacterium]NIT39149.1 cupin domain-containing protein [Candidatus Latescibacterota bacterium]
MKITNLDRIEKIPVDMEGAKDVLKQVPISREDGAPTFSFRVFTIQPNGNTPCHTHPYEHVNYIIEGQGAVVTGDGEEIEIERGDFVLIRPDETHQYRNKSATDPFVMICAVPKEHE